MKEKVCAFTGHRPQNLPFGFNEADERCQTLKKLLRYAIEKLITEKGVTLFVSGMALGVDIYAAE
ncbi:MAG: SLOG family protein, partial [Acutalibacteraceae bacterium]|nr:SLOG family protein [Acutalibacteraceae bacterium]